MTTNVKIDVNLSAGGMRKLAQNFRNMSAQMEALEPEVATKVTDIICDKSLLVAKEELGAIPTDVGGLVDGNELGSVILNGYNVALTSPDAPYIEYGTGIEGVRHKYPGYKRGGYTPQAYGHQLGTAWYYKNDATNEAVKTSGRPAYAPIWKTKFRISTELSSNTSNLRKKINKLLSKEIIDAFDS